MTSTAPSFRTRGLLRLGALALGLLVLQPALARKDDRQKPMNVENAQRFDGKYAPNSTATFYGNVVITQGTMKVTGDKAVVHFDGDQNVDHVLITGAPAHIQEMDDSGNLMLGHASQLDYDNNSGIAVLTGHAFIQQKGRGEAHGDKLTYNTQTSEMTGVSGDDGRVHMTFIPKPKPAAAKGSTQPAKTSTAAPTSANPPAGTPAHAGSAATPQGQH
ncbi:lipopolysaccharide transport periplasmic protein LptA [Rhodanobacter sp. 115]|jgi:lipopolysaccharide export system protein LptA|uniref:lipopolysaccharide transport periplasmic protein LptA n=2 Tax=Rhodanobacter sp. FW021-MT20 TaxID=1162282 RepID=UPI000680EA1A|nr:lipopolysaccharide transport periplasmic protein LptA [Rhodanobacter sp. 115]